MPPMQEHKHGFNPGSQQGFLCYEAAPPPKPSLCSHKHPLRTTAVFPVSTDPWGKFSLILSLSPSQHFGVHPSPVPQPPQAREGRRGAGSDAGGEGTCFAQRGAEMHTNSSKNWHLLLLPQLKRSSSPKKYPTSLFLALSGFLFFSSPLLFTGCLSAFFNFKAVKTFSGHKGLT